jgi:hypothetical protein
VKEAALLHANAVADRINPRNDICFAFCLDNDGAENQPFRRSISINGTHLVEARIARFINVC